MKRKIYLYDAEHPARQKAIEIMEYIAEFIGQPTIFDCRNGDSKWYKVEDEITEIINRRGK